MDNDTPMSVLNCGCLVKDNKLVSPCGFHYENQPVEGDPLYKHLANRQVELPDLEKFTEFEFLNDGKKPVYIRVTSQSSPNNPIKVEKLEMKKLYIKQKGFLKLWDYEDSYHLLVV